MRNASTILTSTRIERQYFVSGPQTGQVASTSVVPNSTGSVQRTVTSSAVIPSDFKTNNNWNYYVTSIKPLKGFAKAIVTSSGKLESDYTGYIGSIAPSQVADWTILEGNLYDRALGRLNDKVRGDLDLSVDLAESKKVWKSMSTSIERYATALRRFSSIPRASKTLAEEWLAFQYGWKPLVSTIYGSADERLRYVLNRLESIRAQKTVYIDSDQSALDIQTLGLGFVVPSRRTILGKSTVKIGITLKIPEESLRLDRWSSLNPVSIGWELLPFSFVADWFVDIGSYLRNVETSLVMLRPGWFQTGYVTYYHKRHVQHFMRNTVYNSVVGGRTYSIDASASRWETSCRRTVLTSYPFPRFPTFKVDLGWQRLLSAAALTRTVLGVGGSANAKQLFRGKTNTDIVEGSRWIPPRGVRNP